MALALDPIKKNTRTRSLLRVSSPPPRSPGKVGCLFVRGRKTDMTVTDQKRGQDNLIAGRKCPEEVKRKISASLLGRTRTPEHCANLSKAMTGLTRSPEHCAAISAGRTGIQYSQAGREALTQGHLLFVTAAGSVYAKFMGSWKPALRLAWTFYHGVIPKGKLICPRNGDRLDASEENLEAMTKGEHIQHQKLNKIVVLAA